MREISLLQLGRAAQVERFDGADREHRAQLERQIRGGHELAHGGAQHVRHGLPAELGVCAQRRPATGDVLLVRLLEAFRGRHAFGAPARAFLVTALVDGLEHGLGKTRGFAQYLFGQLR